MAGYLFRNAQYRLDLQRSIDEADGSALPSRAEAADPSETAYAGWDGFADGSQTKHVQVTTPPPPTPSSSGSSLVFPLHCIPGDLALWLTKSNAALCECVHACMQGNVLRWHEEHGTIQMPATEYITMLEKEVTALRKQVCILSGRLCTLQAHLVCHIALQVGLTQNCDMTILVYRSTLGTFRATTAMSCWTI